jgi:hypothetical protein
MAAFGAAQDTRQYKKEKTLDANAAVKQYHFPEVKTGSNMQ